jgi:biopolymer transport protein TolR
MAMTAGGGSGFTSEINVTPMVDIMLVLLIIFMVVTPLLQSGVSVVLPKEMRNPEEDPSIIKESSVVIAITGDNQFYIGKDKVDIADLKDKIQKRMESKKPEDRIVYVRSDIHASYGSVVELINTIRQAGIDQIGLVAEKKKGLNGPAHAPGAPKA